MILGHEFTHGFDNNGLNTTISISRIHSGLTNAKPRNPTFRKFRIKENVH